MNDFHDFCGFSYLYDMSGFCDMSDFCDLSHFCDISDFCDLEGLILTLVNRT